jgi:hypothetical protein
MFSLVRNVPKCTKERANRLFPGNSARIYRPIRIVSRFRGGVRYIVPLRLALSRLLTQRQITDIMPLFT